MAEHEAKIHLTRATARGSVVTNPESFPPGQPVMIVPVDDAWWPEGYNGPASGRDRSEGEPIEQGADDE